MLTETERKRVLETVFGFLHDIVVGPFDNTLYLYVKPGVT